MLKWTAGEALVRRLATPLARCFVGWMCATEYLRYCREQPSKSAQGSISTCTFPGAWMQFP